mmetsp:Transcript_12647/g.38091  ORF Transcript_12647/g.38091 Transcript_12647/m.38091 type:complete len:347 (-) Transcript_12647:953-1993(-)
MAGAAEAHDRPDRGLHAAWGCSGVLHAPLGNAAGAALHHAGLRAAPRRQRLHLRLAAPLAAEVAGCADAGGLGGLLLPGCQESAPQRGGGRTVPGGDLARVPVASHDAVAVAGPAHGVHVCHPVVRCGESAASRTYPGGAVGCGGCAAPWHMFELVRPPGSSHGVSGGWHHVAGVDGPAGAAGHPGGQRAWRPSLLRPPPCRCRTRHRSRSATVSARESDGDGDGKRRSLATVSASKGSRVGRLSADVPACRCDRNGGYLATDPASGSDRDGRVLGFISASSGAQCGRPAWFRNLSCASPRTGTRPGYIRGPNACEASFLWTDGRALRGCCKHRECIAPTSARQSD